MGAAVPLRALSGSRWCDVIGVAAVGVVFGSSRASYTGGGGGRWSGEGGRRRVRTGALGAGLERRGGASGRSGSAQLVRAAQQIFLPASGGRAADMKVRGAVAANF